MKKTDTEDQDICNILFPVCFEHPILQIICFTDMKVRLYAGGMNLNRKIKKVFRNTETIFRKQNGENCYVL